MTNVDNALQTALGSLGLPVFPNLYQGNELEYIVTNHNAIPVVYAERKPQAARHIVTVRYFLPFKKNPNPMILQIEQALFNNGFTFPDMTDVSDSEGQIYAMTCEYINAGGAYGSS